jgi:hypothetical protein
MINYKVFVSSKFRTDDWSSEQENVYWAKVYARFVVKYYNMIPIVPHLIHTTYLDDNKEDERELGIDICKLEILNSDSITFFIRDNLPEESRMSSGMMAEHHFANDNGKFMNFIIHDDTGKILRVENSSLDKILVGKNLHNIYEIDG